MREFAIINNRTNERMERTSSMEEAKAIKAQYDEMGKEENNYYGFNEYFGTYRIEMI